MTITVKFDDRQIRAALTTLGSQAPLAVARALNKSIVTVRSQAVKEIAKDVGLTQKDVRAVMGTKLATRSDLVASVTVTGARIPLIKFKARETKAGVTYKLPGGRGLAPGAFKATMRSGHEGVFKRKEGSTRRGPAPNYSGLPIVELHGPSLPRVFSKAAIAKAMRRVAQSVMPKNLAHEVSFLLSKRGAA